MTQSILNKKYTKKPWNPRDDGLLMDTINNIGRVNWNVIASHLPGRTGKQCRERYNNHLIGDIKKGDWTEAEMSILLESHVRLGNQWANISKLLPGRSCNDVKNRCKSLAKRGACYNTHYTTLPQQRRMISDKFKFLRNTTEQYPTCHYSYPQQQIPQLQMMQQSCVSYKTSTYNSGSAEIGNVLTLRNVAKESVFVVGSVLRVTDNIENIDTSVHEGLYYFQHFLQSLENRSFDSI